MSAGNTSAESGKRPGFYSLFAIVLGLVLIAGFGRTFFLKPLFATRGLSVPLVIHGLCGTSWFALLIRQAYLVRSRRLSDHRANGTRFGPALVVIALLSAAWIVVLGASDGKPTGSGLPDNVALFIQLGTMTWFGGLAFLGFRTIRRPDYHKRYMVMATIAMLAPAYSRLGRLMPDGHFPVDTAFLATPLIGALLVYDIKSLGRPHPVTLWAGLGYLAYVAVRVPIGRSDLWTGTIAPFVFGM